jgi:hypothetical protein
MVFSSLTHSSESARNRTAYDMLSLRQVRVVEKLQQVRVQLTDARIQLQNAVSETARTTLLFRVPLYLWHASQREARCGIVLGYSRR